MSSSDTWSDTLIRTLSLSGTKVERIKRFLKLNPFFDFSSLARLAITRFIADPSLELTTLEPAPRDKGKTMSKELR